MDFAFDMLNIMKKLNEEGNSEFEITIGMNTSGPINCGILGHTRPVFDIIGDSVNVASRMICSGFIQISATTFSSMKFMNYYIKEYGEIQIKGKCQKKTFLVGTETFIMGHRKQISNNMLV